MKLKALYIFILFFSSLNFSQKNEDQLELATSKGTFYLPVYNRQGAVYFSINKFAEALNIKNEYDPESEKLKLDFSNSVLIITAKNPFLILNSEGEKNIYQLPTTTYLFSGQIFIPLEYFLGVLRKALNKNIIYDSPDRLIITEEILSHKNMNSFSGIYDMNLDEKANGTLVRLKSNQKIKAYTSSFKNNILTITLKNVHADISKISRVSGEGLIKKIESRNIGADTEIKFELAKEYTTNEVISAVGSNDVLITLHNKIFVRNEEKEKYKEKWDFDVVVLDAGHGGHDPGTIGVGGVKEKDINLAVVLKLGKLIEQKMKDVKVVYTRKSDNFVELYKRGKIANEKGGKLFISVHCNSTPKKPSNANGYEIYLLRPGRTKEAIEIAERENSVIQFEDNPQRYEELTDENFILVSMAHSSYMKYSEKFSSLLNEDLKKEIRLDSRGIKQAGFYVLVGASMPSVLIETGFLSNKHDAAYLKSSKGQNAIAKGIFEAIVEFKEHYEKSMETEL